MAADGSIVIETSVDDKEAQKELNRLNRKIESLNDQIYIKQKQKMPLAKQAEELMVQLDLAKDKLQRMQSSPGSFGAEAIKEQQETVSALQTKWNSVQGKVEKYDESIQRAQIGIEISKEKAGEIQQKMAQAGSSGEKMAQAMDRMQKSANRFSMRLREVVRSALVFTVISRGLGMMREWLGKVIKTNAEASSAIARLKGALLTLAQPLLKVIIPAFIALVNVLTKVISTISGLMSLLFGTTAKASAEAAEELRNETEALNGVGSAAKKAGKSMASFDEINQLSGKGDGGGGTGSTAIQPNFDISEDEGALQKMLNLVKLIGTAFLYWKIPKSLRKGLLTIIGLFMTLDGAIGFVRSTFDAWTNGVNKKNALSMIARAAEIALGLFIALGPTLGPIAAGISLVVTGITMLVTGFHDAFENGWNLYNLLLSLAGILAAGLGIGLITGSWIPLLISGIAAIVLAITVAYGEGENLIAGIKEILSGFIDFFVGVFTGDFDRAVKGICKIFEGIKTVVFAVLDSFKNMMHSFLEWLDQKTNGKIRGILNAIGKTFDEKINWLKTTLGGFIDSAKTIFSGLLEFISGVFSGDWENAWKGICNVFIGIINALIAGFESFINFFVLGINTVINALNALSFDVPDWVPGIGGNTWGFNIPNVPPVSFDRIPELARGAVIPPNREFLAVLGDQKHGTNIEAPADLIRQIVRSELQSAGFGGGEQTVILELDKTQLGKVVYRLNNAEMRRLGVNLAGV